MKKRILAIILCVAMLLSVVPFTLTASATADDGIAGYWMDVVSEEKFMSYDEGNTSGASNIFMKADQDPLSQEVMYGSAGGSGVYVRENDGEYYVILNPNEVLDDNNKTKDIEGAIYPNPLSGRGNYSAGNRGKGLPADVDTTGFTHLAIRIRITGGTDTQYSAFDVHLGGAGTRTLNLQNGYFIDNNTKTATEYTTSQTVLGFTGEVDGWLVFPVTADQKAWVTTNGDGFTVRFHAEACTHGVSNSNWQNKILWFGDMAVITNETNFRLTHTGPAFEATSTDNTITVTSNETNAVYSLDKDAEASEWLALDAFNATLTKLDKDTKYTIYAKYTTGTIIGSKEVWTSPYATHNGDGASYVLNVYDNVNNYILKFDYYNQGTNPIGYPAAYALAKTPADDGKYDDGAHNGVLFVRNIGGETFIEFDKNEVYPDGHLSAGVDRGCVNQGVNNNVITYGGHINTGSSDSVATDVGIHSSIDRTNLTHVAMRVKIKDVAELNNVTSKFSIYLNGGKNKEADLADAYLIDATGAIIDPEWSGINFVFTSEFDGWIVFPFSAYGENGKSYWTDTSASVRVDLHDNDTPDCANNHGGSDSNWDNRILYLGDILVIESENAFKSVHACGVAGHKEGAGVPTKATCTEDAYTSYTCSVCGNIRKDVQQGTATNHPNKTTDEVGATCYADGYKKVYCPDCETMLEDVKYTNRPQHTPSTPVNVPATCYKDGSEGAIVCTVCQANNIETILTPGTPISKDTVQHTPSAERVGVVEATCTKKGHEGNIICTVCEENGYEYIITPGKETDMLDHVEADKLDGVVEATCSKKGFSGNKVCKDCGFVMEAGKETDMLKHVEADKLVDVVEAKCGVAGYTGDKVCKDCGATIEEGKEVAALEHKAAAELKNKKDATATEKGYTGDKVCELCGTVMEAGKEIAATGTTTTPDTTPDGEGTGSGDNAGSGTEGEGSTAPETGDSASILVAVLMALMAGAVVVLAKKRAIEK